MCATIFVALLMSLFSMSLASRGCDIVLRGRDLENTLVEQLAKSVMDNGKLSVFSAAATGYCGSVGTAGLTGKAVGKIPAAVVLTSGSYDSAVSTALGDTVASYTTGFNLEDSMVQRFAGDKAVKDVVMFEMVMQTKSRSQVLMIDYVWATDELNSNFDDLAVIAIAECTAADCGTTGSWTLLSTVGDSGSTVSLHSLRKTGSLLNRNYAGGQNTPFNSYSEKLTTKAFVMNSAKTYKLKAFVADVEDTSMDTVLYLGSIQLSDTGVAAPTPPSPTNIKSKGNDFPVGPVVGAAVGGVVGIVTVVALVIAFLYWRQRRTRDTKHTPSLASIAFEPTRDEKGQLPDSHGDIIIGQPGRQLSGKASSAGRAPSGSVIGGQTQSGLGLPGSATNPPSKTEVVITAHGDSKWKSAERGVLKPWSAE